MNNTELLIAIRARANTLRTAPAHAEPLHLSLRIIQADKLEEHAQQLEACTSRQMDMFTTEYNRCAPRCHDCGGKLQLVRPGKWQCQECG